MVVKAVTAAVLQATPQSQGTVPVANNPAPVAITPLSQPQVRPPAAVSVAGVDLSSIPRVDRSRRRVPKGGDPAAVVMVPTGHAIAGMPSQASASINAVRIAPVAAASGMMNVLPVQLSAALLGAMPTKFSGEAEHWPEWKRRWLSFMENVEEAMPAITDAQMLTIFKGLLDDASVHKLEAEQMVDLDIGYEEFLATLDLGFGSDNVANLRARWYNLRLRHQGSLRFGDWRSFSYQFLNLMVLVGDATEEEAERLLLKALPIEWRKKVETEVDN
jgi:hypothetical protein